MIANKFLYLITLGVAVGLGPRVTAQVQTDIPAAVPGAKPVSVERSWRPAISTQLRNCRRKIVPSRWACPLYRQNRFDRMLSWNEVL
jgi:hypothetical protein